MVGYPEIEQLLKYIPFRVAPKRLFWIETYPESEMVPVYRHLQRQSKPFTSPQCS